MTSPLWTSQEIEAATGGRASSPFEVTGVTFDSREVEPGHLFVAMPGTVADGHEFVDKAFAAGAAAAIVSRPVEGPHVLVEDTAAALTALAIAARNRVDATILGVTGSVGKTSTKEALAAALERRCRGRVHRSVKSYNNHTGVPLSLARMPRETKYGVFEMGMSGAGEIRALTALVRPHVAVVTTIASAHIEHLGSMEAIADAKAEIFEGLEPGGTAILPNDSTYRDRMLKAARKRAEQIITFGSGDADVAALHAVRADNGGSLVTARLIESELTFNIAQRGEHWVSNALAVLAAVEAAGADLAAAGLALGDMGGLKGRGERHRIEVLGGTVLLIDESYNANPASMAATLKSLAEESVHGRRVAVLAAVEAAGADLAAAGLALGDMGGLKGRGERHRIEVLGGTVLLIDESYNANPASMAATLKSLAEESVHGRRVAVLGTMRELGEHSDREHAALAEHVLGAGVELLVLVGDETRPLEEVLAGRVEIHRAEDPESAADTLLRLVRAGDVVLVKASNGVGLARLVERVAGGRP